MHISYDSATRVSSFSRRFAEAAIHRCTFVKNVHKKFLLRKDVKEEDYTKVLSRLDEKTQELVLPRGFPFEEFGNTGNLVLGKDHRIFRPPKFPFPKRIRELLPSQREVFRNVLKASKDSTHHGGFLLILPVSTGKTTICSLLAAELNQRTLIVVDSSIIYEGWIRDLCQCYPITSSDIGEIRGTKTRIGKHFTITTFQTMHRRRHLWPKLFKKFGTLIVDEAHVASADTFHDLVTSCPARYRIGVSATRERKDRMHGMLDLLFGPPFHHAADPRGSSATSLQVSEVRVIKTDFRYPQRTIYDYNKFLKILCGNVDRNRLIAQLVADLVKQGRKPLIVSARREHVAELHSMVTSILSANPKLARKCALLMGGGSGRAGINKMLDDFSLGKKSALFSTTQFIVKGASIPQLDTLVICTQIGFYENVKQLVGRVKRAAPGKKEVWVYDILDEHVYPCRAKFKYQHCRAYQEMKIPGYG